MMNVVIGLKLTGGGQAAGRDQERACAIGDRLLLPLSVSLSSVTEQKEGKAALHSLLNFRGENRQRKLYAQLFFPPIFLNFTRETSASGTVHTGGGGVGGGERMLNNVTECEEGDVGANSQGE